MLPPEILGVCRLCLVTEHVDSNIFENNSKQLYYKISRCLPITISEDDQLPKRVCQNCDDKVHMVYEFWNQALDAQKHLLSWLNSETKSSENNCNFNSNSYSFSCQTQDDDDDNGVSAVFVNDNDDSDAENDLVRSALEDVKPNEIKHEENGSPLKQLLGRDDPLRSSDQPGSCPVNVNATPRKRVLTRRRALRRSHDSSGIAKPRIYPVDEEAKRVATKQLKQLDVAADRSILRCRHCDQVFKTSNERQKHERSAHPKRNVQYECDKCDYRTYTKGCFTTHLKRHIKQYNLFCEECNLGFYTNTELTTHEIKTHNMRPFQCAECNEMFTTKGSLATHIMGHDPSNAYICEICGKTYKKKNSYKRHQFRSHMGTMAKAKCDVCGRVLSSKDHLRRHMLTHTDIRNWVCATCGKCFLSRTYLNEHTRIHLGIRPYKCDVCEKSFTQRGSLTIHKRSHTGERPYRCEYCHKGFVMGTLLRYHLRKCNEAKLHEQLGLKKSTLVDTTDQTILNQRSDLNVEDDMKTISYEAAFVNKVRNDEIYARKMDGEVVELETMNAGGMLNDDGLGNR